MTVIPNTNPKMRQAAIEIPRYLDGKDNYLLHFQYGGGGEHHAGFCSSGAWLLMVPPLTSAGNADTDGPMSRWQSIGNFLQPDRVQQLDDRRTRLRADLENARRE